MLIGKIFLPTISGLIGSYFAFVAQGFSEEVSVDQQQKAMTAQRSTQATQISNTSVKPAIEAGQIVPQKTEQSWPIKTIQVDQMGEKIPVKTRQIVHKYENKKLTKQDMVSLIREVTNLYIDAGFSTTLMGLDFSQLRQGHLRVKVLWGRIESITINGKPPSGWREKFLISSALPDVVGKPLNIRDLDQTIENMNNGMIEAKVNINPSPKKDGFSIVDITKTQKNYKGGITLNNSGEKEKSSIWKAPANFYINGPLGNGDKVSLSASWNFFDAHKNVPYYSAAIGWSVPWGANNFSLNGAFSFNRSKQTGQKEYYLDTQNIDLTGSVSRVISRSEKQKTSLQASINYKISETHLDGVKIGVRSQNYYEFGIGASRTQSLGPGSLSGSITAYYGFLSALGDLELSGEAFEGNFRVTGSLSWSQSLNIKGVPFNWSISSGWQYAPYSLPQEQKFSLGDETTIRGFSSLTGAAGDSGGYVSTMLSKTFPVSSNSLFLMPFIGIDFGAVHSWEEKVNPIISLSSVFAGVQLQLLSYASSSITLARPLYDSRNIIEKNPILWFKIGAEF